jgi:HK97 family phage prohead protease
MTEETLDDRGTIQLRLIEGAELRNSDEGTELGFEGRAAPYGVWAPIPGNRLESLARGVFSKSIQEAARGLPLLLHHKHDTEPIGHAVEWHDEPDGLHARWVMANTDDARRIHGLISDGDMSGLSVGFVPLVNDPKVQRLVSPPEVGRVTRKIARLAEVSVVSVPTWAEAVVTHTRAGDTPLTTRHVHAAAWRQWLDGIRA